MWSWIAPIPGWGMLVLCVVALGALYLLEGGDDD